MWNHPFRMCVKSNHIGLGGLVCSLWGGLKGRPPPETGLPIARCREPQDARKQGTWHGFCNSKLKAVLYQIWLCCVPKTFSLLAQSLQ